ncbi:MAG: PIN domain-containing protein [Chloroflexota bacterium]|nr:MAG: PIN domain-containing protein [Chloroflexota bacterium]
MNAEQAMRAILIDTNVLLYAYDPNDLARSERAQNVLRHLEESNMGRVSVQCLAEFFSIATRKLKPPLSSAEALTQIELLARSYPVLDLTLGVILEAARGVRDYQLAYYDAQLWAMAKLNQIPIIFSEDMPSALVLEGVGYVNPFAENFVLEEWA